MRRMEGLDQLRYNSFKKRERRKRKVNAAVCTKQRNRDLKGIVFLACV